MGWPKGVPHPPEMIAKFVATMTGRPGHKQTPATRAKLSELGKRRIVSEHTRRLISLAGKGRKRPKSPEHRAKIAATLRGRPSPNRGKAMSDTQKAKMRIARLGRKDSAETRAKKSASRQGSKNPQWRGGASFIDYPPSFDEGMKAFVRQRDGCACQICGQQWQPSQELLSIHHIDYNKTNSDPVNLVALCRVCHVRTNTNRAHWQTVLGHRAIGVSLEMLPLWKASL